MSPSHRASAALAGAALLLLTGCSLFRSGGTDSFFNSQALATGRILFAGINENATGSSIGIFTVPTISGGDVLPYALGGYDFAGPAITKDAFGQWALAFGAGTLRTLHAVTGQLLTVEGTGSRRLAPSFDKTTPLRMAYMDGSDAGGYDIIMRTGATGAATALTSDASSTVANWTPAWSTDGAWILFAKVMGTTGAESELWRVHPDGTGAELLPITTVEVPTYSIFGPDGTQVFVPGDFTSYKVADGTTGRFNAVRDLPKLQADLDAMGYEFVGSTLTGALHTGDEVTSLRHTFPMSAQWILQGNRLYFDALVAENFGPGPHAVEGIGIFSWVPSSEVLFMHMTPMPISEGSTENYSLSLVHPTIIP